MMDNLWDFPVGREMQYFMLKEKHGFVKFYYDVIKRQLK